VVRKHWNWTGVIETDCGAMNNPDMCGLKQVFDPKTKKMVKLDVCPGGQPHAVQSIKATVDIECQGSFGTLPNASNHSEITITQMQQAVARVFKGRFQIGEFDPDNKFYANVTNETVFSSAHQQLSLEGAEQSLVLVQNAPSKTSANFLPLKKGLKLAVIGPNGNSTAVYQGQYQVWRVRSLILSLSLSLSLSLCVCVCVCVCVIVSLSRSLARSLSRGRRARTSR
jgi:beta-glucosidase